MILQGLVGRGGLRSRHSNPVDAVHHVVSKSDAAARPAPNEDTGSFPVCGQNTGRNTSCLQDSLQLQSSDTSLIRYDRVALFIDIHRSPAFRQFFVPIFNAMFNACDDWHYLRCSAAFMTSG